MVHHFFWIRIVISWSWILILFYKWKTLDILSSHWEWKPFIFFVSFFRIMFKIIKKHWRISGCRRDFSFYIKDNSFLTNTKTWCLFTIGWGNIIKMVWFIDLCFEFSLFRWMKSFCFTEWELKFWCGVIEWI